MTPVFPRYLLECCKNVVSHAGQVVPIVTQLRLDLGHISDKDHGVKGLMRKLLDGVETRLGGLEKEEQYALSCSADPRLAFVFGLHFVTLPL